MVWSRVRKLASPLVAALVVGGVAYAAIPGPDGKIHACYSRSYGGFVRLVDHDRSCKSGETRITWNQQGPPGPPGPAGPPGQQGPPGPAGPPGVSVGETRARFAELSGIGTSNGAFTNLGGTVVPTGDYVAIATVQVTSFVPDGSSSGRAFCELRNDAAFIGGTDTAVPEDDESGSTLHHGTLTFHGGAHIGAFGAELNVRCKLESQDEAFPDYTGQLMVLKINGFF